MAEVKDVSFYRRLSLTLNIVQQIFLKIQKKVDVMGDTGSFNSEFGTD